METMHIINAAWQTLTMLTGTGSKLQRALQLFMQQDVKGKKPFKEGKKKSRINCTLPLFFLTSLITRMRMTVKTKTAPPKAMIRMARGIVSPLLSRHHLHVEVI